MLVQKAKALAREWVYAYARHTSLFGAFFNGSIVMMDGGDPLPAASDVDVNLVLDAFQPPPEKLGKFLYKGALLEVSFLPHDAVSSEEKILSTYEIASGFRYGEVIYDRTGQLAFALAHVKDRFAEPEWVRARLSGVYAKILRGAGGFSPAAPLLDNINPWLFPAGVCAHAILVAALQNPTVRLRYLHARPILARVGRMDFYETLLSLLGCAKMRPAQVQRHLDRLRETFDLAAAKARTAFPFSQDISEIGRPVAIDGSQALIDAGDHREAIFWIAATFERCHRVLRADDPKTHEARLPFFLSLLEDLGVESNTKIAARIGAVKALLPSLETVAQAVYEACQEG